jgi:2-polyprenyl-3-methyl-5-hydroxy-6-metoxy-1,4-benzoquinol methylase
MPMPDQLSWDHNLHYHDYLLRQLPARAGRVLDVGSGTGAFARRLASRAISVDAVDRSTRMIATARTAQPQPSNITWIHGDILGLDLDLGAYDAVTAISSLHHMPLKPALERLGALVRPGGVLTILGPYREATFGDYAISLAAVVINPLVGIWKAAQRQRTTASVEMPVADATTTLAEIREAAREHLTGAVLHRHLFFRYSLIWQRPRP